jgi:hypothetical protein
VNEKHGVSERTVVINQGKRATATERLNKLNEPAGSGPQGLHPQ